LDEEHNTSVLNDLMPSDEPKKKKKKNKKEEEPIDEEEKSGKKSKMRQRKNRKKKKQPAVEEEVDQDMLEQLDNLIKQDESLKSQEALVVDTYKRIFKIDEKSE
jgi:hypothetical protein